MILQKKLLNEFFYHLFIIFFFTFLCIEISSYFDLNRHWTSNIDHEFTLAYNSLLFNEGLKQEYIDHSGYFTILFLSIYIKIINLLNFIEFSNLTGYLNSKNFEISSQKLVFYTRIYSAICVGFMCYILNILFNQISKSKLFSFFITILFLFSYGTLIHLSQLRTELFASFFIISSIISLNKFIDNNKEYYLYLFFIFLYCAILNKAQVFFYVPFILSLFYFKFTEINKIEFKFFVLIKKKKILLPFFILAILYIILKSVSFRINPFSLFFLIFVILCINMFFYKITSKLNSGIIENLIKLNLILVISFTIFKFLLKIHPSNNEMAFKFTFFDIINNIKYSSLTSIEFSFLGIINEFLSKFLIVLNYIFSSINFNSALIISIFLIFFISTLGNRKLSKKNTIFVLYSIIIYFLILYINSFRGLHSYYEIFSQFFLIIPLCLIYFLANNLIKKILFCLILAVPIFIGLNDLKIIKKSLVYDRTDWICSKEQSYFQDWHKKLPKEKLIKEVCLN